MKKSIIKRRKRVVPATQEQSPNHAHLTSFPVSMSPDPEQLENLDFQNHQQNLHRTNSDGSMNLDLLVRDQQLDRQHQYEPPPIGVDFTGYQIDRQRRLSNQSQQQQQQQLLAHLSVHDPSNLVSPSQSHSTLSPFPSANSRKRSFSISDRENLNHSMPENTRSNRLSSISSILNPPQQHQQQQLGDEMPIDPSLSHIGQQQQQEPQTTSRPIIQQVTQYQQNSHLSAPAAPPLIPDTRPPNYSTSNGDSTEWIAQRKARLRLEAKEMREMLRAKERELEELDGEG